MDHLQTLRRIGISVSALAKHFRAKEATVYSWLSRPAGLPPPQAEWLETLAAWLEANPAPHYARRKAGRKPAPPAKRILTPEETAAYWAHQEQMAWEAEQELLFPTPDTAEAAELRRQKCYE